MKRKAPEVHDSDVRLALGRPERSAAGLPSLAETIPRAFGEMGAGRGWKALRAVNQKDGYDCMGCAWPDPAERKAAEFCENGAKAIGWEAGMLTVPTAFWAEHDAGSLASRTEYWLGQQGRLTEPVYKPEGSDHYRPVTWDEAFGIIARELNGLDSPDEAAFYTSGRTSNEAAFVYQLFARAYGSNNLPDCSNMCHESSGLAMTETIGIGKSAVSYADFAKAELIIVMGQNPGTCHPRMLTALEEAKQAGAAIVAVNPLPEAGLINFRNPQRVRGLIGRGTDLADQFLQIRLAGDMALLQAVSKRVLDAEDAAPGTVLDHRFIRQHCRGFEAFREHLAKLDDEEVLAATGLGAGEIDELAQRYIHANRVIITWAMGLTQHRKAVDTIKEIINLLLLRGNIGKPGAGPSPIRGHSNVQGDRTMGIWEKMPAWFLEAIRGEFGFDPPARDGLDAVDSIRAMRDGKVKVLVALGGNLVHAISDTEAAEEAMRRTRLSVQISTKLNRSHAITGAQALILPTLGRTEIDRQATGEQFVTVEDTVCAVHRSQGNLAPVPADALSEVAIVCRMARSVLGGKVSVDWEGLAADYDRIREHISRVVPGFENFNARIRAKDGFVLPHGPRDSRTFPTPDGEAHFTVSRLETITVPPGRLLLQTVRSHDQFNTTTYSMNDRYRGVHKGRMVLFVHPDDLAELGLDDGGYVDVHSEAADGRDRVLRQLRLVAYPSAKGCATAYYPEANVLVPLDSTAEGSNTPASKSVVIRLEPAAAPAFGA
ncbi:FdhF/YdeP family oxidoreductase [Arthrobacter cupressi]|uniref:Formate dehydrogenase major subunit n=1 Tax=Arthrobacter cupressi TaxID=1045773 RepID=A0A1G8WDW6_9MICC|nr:FdhF/YdeP family oxidoreductase [Arthrobacter cupressi]NYD76310.1 formate dehydrogenase major subunit [Arthrobacter cupressi]SDJ76464.1 formate dehydrogenase major subunit [Arthrobacter cupressi]